jgi:hypothetical protein
MNAIDVVLAKKEHIARLANESGAAGELLAVADSENWYRRPKGTELKNLLQALAEEGISINISAKRF